MAPGEQEQEQAQVQLYRSSLAGAEVAADVEVCPAAGVSRCPCDAGGFQWWE